MELLEVLKGYQREFRKVTALEDEIYKIRTQGSALIRGAVSLLLLGVVGPQLSSWFPDKEGLVPWIGILFSIIVYTLWGKLLSMKKKAAIKPLQHQIEVLMKKINSLGDTVPEHYRTADAINCFVHYIETTQATTLPECIKLYVEELRHREQMSAIHEMNSRLGGIEAEVAATKRRID